MVVRGGEPGDKEGRGKGEREAGVDRCVCGAGGRKGESEAGRLEEGGKGENRKG